MKGVCPTLVHLGFYPQPRLSPLLSCSVTSSTAREVGTCPFVDLIIAVPCFPLAFGSIVASGAVLRDMLALFGTCQLVRELGDVGWLSMW